ncbi:MAG: LamG-like jellyroll fold domain-containing protein, partial [Sedimentisphaerales bacterium]
MCRKIIYSVSFIMVLVLMCGVVRADVTVAEDLLVDLRAEDLPYGEGATTWPNHGSLGDFTADGSPLVEDVAGMKAVTFDGGSWFDGPTSTAGIEGDGTRSIEVWAYNPSLGEPEETTVSWAHRGGPDGTNMAFNYCTHGTWGSVGHWGGAHDMGWWGSHSPAPAASTWWHLTYTHDGTATRIYVNGVEESVIDPMTLDTHGGTPIRVAAQADGTGAGVESAMNFTGSIASVRIHDGVLSPADIQRNFKLGRLKAWNSVPADGALLPETWASLSWSPGGFAVSHDVYFDDNFEDVDAGTGDAFRSNETMPFYIVGFAGYPFADGLVNGTTYYWRVDEVNDLHPDSPWRGNVWSFTVPPKKAYEPVPSDDAKYIDTNPTLTWTSGFGAKMHVVYFGEDFDTVNNATGNTPVGPTTYSPGELELGKVYYWRVDELDGATTYKGDVWSFKTIPDILVTDPNLMGWWKFDEGAGATALDWSGHGNHATLMGGPTWTAGYDGDALKLDGADDYAVLPIGELISSMSSATFTTWVNFSNIGGAWQRIFDFGSGTGTYIFLCPRTGTGGPMRLAITTSAGAGESLIDATNTLPSGWHHVAAVVKSGNMQLYLDGAVVASGSTSVIPSDLGRTGSNWLGRSQYAADGYFNGSLDDFRIYDYALSADEIETTMRGDPMLAWNAKPADGTIPDIRAALPLNWSAGEKASQHDVYFGIDADAVDNAETSTPDVYRGRQAATSYTPPEGVEWGGGPYYWRIDEFNTDGTINRGRVWSFTVADFILVDDFESYDTGDNQVWYSWHDGLGYGAPGTDPYFAGNGTGAAVGDETTGSYMEETIVHSGGRSLPFNYDNNKQGYARYSETELALTSPRDWTIEGLAELSLWFRGYPASVGSFVEGPVGTYTMTGSGADIWGESDQFHYAFKVLTGPGSIVAKVESVSNTDVWAKAGVMIRETLDGGSTHAMMVVTPSSGIAFQRRFETDGASSDTTTGGITAPYWVKIERGLAGNFTAYSSTNGTTWQIQGQPEPFQMGSNAYIGLAVTAHNATATCEAKFSNVTITGNVGQLWTNQDVGILSNDAEPLYVAVANSAGNPAVVV